VIALARKGLVFSRFVVFDILDKMWKQKQERQGKMVYQSEALRARPEIKRLSDLAFLRNVLSEIGKKNFRDRRSGKINDDRYEETRVSVYDKLEEIAPMVSAQYHPHAFDWTVCSDGLNLRIKDGKKKVAHIDYLAARALRDFLNKSAKAETTSPKLEKEKGQLYRQVKEKDCATAGYKLAESLYKKSEVSVAVRDDKKAKQEKELKSYLLNLSAKYSLNYFGWVIDKNDELRLEISDNKSVSVSVDYYGAKTLRGLLNRTVVK
jgi:hypothetical protein